MKYQVSWENKLTNEINIHGTFETLQDALQSIYDWWDKNEFTPRYIRHWNTGNRATIDYGSQHMFYYISEVEDE